MTRVAKTLIVLAALFALAVPAAQAGYRDVIKDCAQDGSLDRKYSNSELIQARKKLPSDLDEYSDCREVIGAAIGGAGRHSGGGGGGGGHRGGGASGGNPSSPGDPSARQQDQGALDAIQQGGATKPKVRVGDQIAQPGKNGLFRPASAENGLPLPLLLSLIAIALMAVGGGAYALRRRIPALARIPLPRISLPRRVSLSRQRR
jgi:hypothetical protein